MKTLSYWARSHKAAARILIVLSYLLLNVLGWLTGGLFHDSGILLTETALFVTITIYLAGAVFYPAKRGKAKWSCHAFFVRQKTCDLFLISATFGLVVYAGNRTSELPTSAPLAAAVSNAFVLPEDSVKKHKSVEEFALAVKDANGKLWPWKERKKLLKQQVYELKKAPAMTNGERTFLTILFVLLAIGLELGIMALSCSLSCSGAEGLAVLVGVGGTARH